MSSTAVSSGTGAPYVYLTSGGLLNYAGTVGYGLYLWEFNAYEGNIPYWPYPVGLEATSNTSNSIGTGSKTFTISLDSTIPGQAIPVGVTARAYPTGNFASYVQGTVTSHVGTTLILNVGAIAGSGTGITSWVIQAAGAVTRAAAICTVPLSSLIGSAGDALWTGTEGALVVQAITARGKPLGSAVQVLLQLDDGTSSNRVRIVRNATGEIRCVVDVAGVNQVDLLAGTAADNTEIKVAFTFATNAFYAAMNGGAPVGSVSGSLPTGLTTKRLGSGATGSSQWDGTIKLSNLYNRVPAAISVQTLSTM